MNKCVFWQIYENQQTKLHKFRPKKMCSAWKEHQNPNVKQIFCQWICMKRRHEFRGRKGFTRNGTHWVLNSFVRYRFARLKFHFACNRTRHFVMLAHTHTYCFECWAWKFYVFANVSANIIFFSHFLLYIIHYSIGNFLVCVFFFSIKLCWWFGFCFWFICWKMELCVERDRIQLGLEISNPWRLHARTHTQTLSIWITNIPLSKHQINGLS